MWSKQPPPPPPPPPEHSRSARSSSPDWDPPPPPPLPPPAANDGEDVPFDFIQNCCSMGNEPTEVEVTDTNEISVQHSRSYQQQQRWLREQSDLLRSRQAEKEGAPLDELDQDSAFDEIATRTYQTTTKRTPSQVLAARQAKASRIFQNIVAENTTRAASNSSDEIARGRSSTSATSNNDRHEEFVTDSVVAYQARKARQQQDAEAAEQRRASARASAATPVSVSSSIGSTGVALVDDALDTVLTALSFGTDDGNEGNEAVDVKNAIGYSNGQANGSANGAANGHAGAVAVARSGSSASNANANAKSDSKSSSKAFKKTRSTNNETVRSDPSPAASMSLMEKVRSTFLGTSGSYDNGFGSSSFGGMSFVPFGSVKNEQDGSKVPLNYTKYDKTDACDSTGDGNTEENVTRESSRAGTPDDMFIEQKIGDTPERSASNVSRDAVNISASRSRSRSGVPMNGARTSPSNKSAAELDMAIMAKMQDQQKEQDVSFSADNVEHTIQGNIRSVGSMDNSDDNWKESDKENASPSKVSRSAKSNKSSKDPSKDGNKMSIEIEKPKRNHVLFWIAAFVLIFGAAAATAAVLVFGGHLSDKSGGAATASTGSQNGGVTTMGDGDGGNGEDWRDQMWPGSSEDGGGGEEDGSGGGGGEGGYVPGQTGDSQDGGSEFDDGAAADADPTPAPVMPPTPMPITMSPTDALPIDPPRDYGGEEVCAEATSDISPLTHAQPVEGSVVSRIAYGSCFRPDKQISDVLWRDVREEFRPDLWIWLGDNMYAGGTNIDDKRLGYNEAREDEYYATYGPIAEPKIPVTGTWDDNDFGDSNGGKHYQCIKSSQAEFVTHMGIPESDPRHPAQGERQRFGVYSSQMFAKPSGGENGIHVINLDARSHRSPSFDDHGDCEGVESTMLGAAQWKWLEREMLQRRSVIKVISTGVQVLPPSSRARPLNEFCAYDGDGGTFDAANEDVGEGPEWRATTYESWAEIPQERTRLLRLAERSINTGMAKRIIFLTGEQHWAEIMVKRLPPSNEGGEAHIFYEVTASGIDQNWIEDVTNPTRVRVRSADQRGDGLYLNECNFPFIVDGEEYNDCADVFDTGIPGCSTETSDDVHVDGQWGNCLPKEEELVPRERSTHGRLNKCTDNYHHTCSAQANYGGMVVDWGRGTIRLSIFTPHEREVVASSITVDI